MSSTVSQIEDKCLFLILFFIYCLFIYLPYCGTIEFFFSSQTFSLCGGVVLLHSILVSHPQRLCVHAGVCVCVCVHAYTDVM